LNKEEEADDSAHSEHGEEEEQIVVKRQEDERDPELEADFDRELAKLMAESMDARKERKARFDVPLPMRPTQRDMSVVEKQSGPEITNGPGHMKFGLLTKRGNKQQVGIYTRYHYASRLGFG
jgi:regulator of nonsense transcripts 2